ncbi:leucine zipper putative tumor suppressor 2-like [Brachypodium distachyon]|uniref:leucine zipper putative tumor suppressor 2-like n=1 Tax=Brachypodium distachyon TaxID=15368 RepID=UPI00053004F6|nr:leucine zipper putative tumor suppressor 2-like [Brachypodium distachyon]|eukprot:XP_010236542.1 leucine zipper putative tumor suppressor 2-like [Brachypodium distachyon]
MTYLTQGLCRLFTLVGGGAISLDIQDVIGPNGPTTGADGTVIDLPSDAEDVELEDEPEVAPAPSPAVPDTTVVAPTAATGVGLGGTPPASQAGGAGPAAAPQETTPAGGAAPPPDPQPTGAGVEEDVVVEQQAATCKGKMLYMVREHHELAKLQLGEVRDVERERQELSRQREETQQARDEATTPVIPEAELHRQLEAQRAEHQQVLDLLAAAREKANKEHEDVLATAQARLNEKCELVSGYSSQLQALRVKLEEQAKAAEDAAAASTRREKELQEQFRTRELELEGELNFAKERSARLESEPTTAQGELALLDTWSDSEDGLSHTKAVGKFIDEVVERM